MLGRRLGVLKRVQLVAVRDVRVVAGGDVVAGFMVLGSFAVMVRSMLQMFGGFVVMMVRRMLFAHGFPPWQSVTDARNGQRQNRPTA
jgi:hypothetical protein